MRTGEFAALHNITYDTIRHYLEMGLLVAEKEGGHYRFGPQDSKDLERINELKSLDFTLSEIQTILCFQRLAGEKTDEFLNHYLGFLENKRE